MGFFDDFVKSVASGDIEKTLLGGLDKVEGVVKTGLDMAENGLDKAGEAVETAGSKAELAAEKIETVVEKLPGNGDKV